MSNPWDPFPLPACGDDDERLTFEFMGRALDQWEAVEFRLSRLYSVFDGDPDGASMQKYGGRNSIFQQRLRGLREIEETYFIAHPSQQAEGTFGCLIRAAEGFADRRNEVAHGMVLNTAGLTFFSDRFKTDSGMQFALIPPYYLLKKHGHTGIPKYAYTSVELRMLRDRLFALSEKIGEYQKGLLRPTNEPSPEQ